MLRANRSHPTGRLPRKTSRSFRPLTGDVHWHALGDRFSKAIEVRDVDWSAKGSLKGSSVPLSPGQALDDIVRVDKQTTVLKDDLTHRAKDAIAYRVPHPPLFDAPERRPQKVPRAPFV